VETARQNLKHWLVFRLGDHVMCASALDVEGIIQRPKAMVKLPAMPDYAVGAFLFRDRSTAAISLRRKLKVQQGEDCATGPFIVTRIRDALVAFWVDEAKDVIEEKDADWRPMPAMLAGGLFERFAVRERELVLQTSFAALLKAKVKVESLAILVGTHAAADVVPDRPPRPPEASRTETAPCFAPQEKLRFTPAPSVSAALANQPPKVSRTIDTRRNARPTAPRPHAVARTMAPRRDPSKVAVAMTSRHEPEAGRKAPSLRYWLAAAGGAVAAIAVILHGHLPGPSRAVLPGPASFAQAGLPPEREQAPLIKADPAKPLLENPVAKADAIPAAKPASRIHVVIRGDTLWDLAKKHVGDASRYPELATVSSIHNPHLIHPGDVVRIEIREPK
jgi:chemotaxis signal transduction protein